MAEKDEHKHNVHAGHRQRMKQEFLARGLDGMPDHKILELLLFYALPQGDVNPLAHTLIDHFGSLNGVFHATYDQLLSVKGVGENTAILIQLVTAIGGRHLHEQPDMKGAFRESWQFRELLAPEFFGARNERLYIICLDKKMKLLSPPKCLSEGNFDTVAISMRQVLETALACNAAAVVLAHNHVGGLAIPSSDDVITTRHLDNSLKQIGILLYDHFIEGDGDIISMRESGYFTK